MAGNSRQSILYMTLQTFAFINQLNKFMFTYETNLTLVSVLLNSQILPFLSPYIHCNFVPLEIQEMYGRNSF